MPPFPDRRAARGTVGRVATLFAGSVGGQVLALAAAPVLSRLYPPAAFGAFGLFNALASLAAPLATGGAEAAIVLEREGTGADAAFGLSLALAAAGAVAVAATVLASGRPCGLAAGLGASVLALATGQILASRALAAGRLRAVAAGRLARGAGIGAAQLALAFVAGTRAPSLIAGALAGQGLAVVATLALGRGALGRPSVRRDAWRDALRRHRTLLLWAAPQTLLNNAGNTAIPLILAATAGDVAVGAYTVANRVVMLAAATLGEAARQSLLVSFVAVGADDASLGRAVRRAIASLLLLLAPAVAFAAAFGPVAFAICFGSRWRSAGVDFAILFAAEAVGIANIPSVVAITVRGLQRPFFLWGAATVPLRLVAVLAAARFGGAADALLVHAGLSAASSLAVGTAVDRRLDRGRSVRRPPTGAQAA